MAKEKKEKPTTKICKHCKTEIPYGAKVCPHCRKKQKMGLVPKIIIALIALLLIGSCFGSGEEQDEQKEAKTEFSVGETFANDEISINFISTGDYKTDNMFIEPAEGNKYIYAEFEIENLSDSDLGVGSWDFSCYADTYACEETYFEEDALTMYDNISSGKKIKGKIYFEIPEDSENIILEYMLDYWDESKITFVIK